MAKRVQDQGERLLTAAEFERMPEEDAYRIELVRGRLVRSPRPAPLHGRLVARLSRLLDEFVENAGTGVVLADVGALLARNPDTVRGPDVAFYSHERIPESGYATGFWGPPDLAVEITSPSNQVSEIQAKVTEYLDAGVRLVWVIDPPTRTVTVYSVGGEARIVRSDQVLEGGEVLGGFRLPLTAFFAM
jgi:Uma2 family endonuclease